MHGTAPCISGRGMVRCAIPMACFADSSLTRRDLLNANLLASGAALLNTTAPLDLLAQRLPQQRNEFDGYGGIGDYAHANGNTFDVVSEGHKLRDAAYARVDPRKAQLAGSFDCVIVGGGISGLAAALFFQRQTGGRGTCLVIDDHAIFGGQARANEFDVGGERLVANQ